MKLKTAFFGYYPPTENDFVEWWQTALFVFDANALLDLYGLQTATREQLFLFLESIKGRIWIPHQAGFEFIKNRGKVIDQQANKYKSVIGKLDKLLPDMQFRAEEAKKDLDAPDLPESVRDVAKLVFSNFETLLKQVQESTDGLAAEVAQLIEKLETERKTQTAIKDQDPILDRLAALIGDNIGDAYDAKKLKTIYAEGAERYKTIPPIPPGFKDQDDKNKQGDEIYGDLLVWFQTIDKAKSERKPILMVNNEQKVDWVEPWGDGKRIRRDLIQEMYKETGQPFYMYSLPDFMAAASKYLGASFSDADLSDASRVEQEEVTRHISNEAGASDSLSTLYGKFVLAWRTVEGYIHEIVATLGSGNRHQPLSQALSIRT